MLKYQQDRQNSAQANSGPGSAGAESSAPKLNSVMNGESLEDIRKVGGSNGTRQAYHRSQLLKIQIYMRSAYVRNLEFVPFQNLLKKQVETRTADGRRRITPLCIAQLDTG